MPIPDLRALRRRAGEVGRDIAIVARVSRDLPGFLRVPLTADEARDRLIRRLATRDRLLMTVLERAVFGQPRSPYRALLRHAGCELGDLRALIAGEGVDGALKVLASRGVYVTYDEFKGRREARRGSARFSFRPDDFDNPLAPPHFRLYTGGSGGQPTAVGFSLAAVEEWAETMAIVLAAHAVHRPRLVFWWPVALPRMAMVAKLGYPVAGWFYPVHPLPRRVHLAAWHQALLGRLVGHRFPRPVRCDLEHAEQLAAWIAARRPRERPIVIWTMASAGARLASAARRAGHDLRGVTLFVGSEAITEARREQMAASGARVLMRYTSTELPGLSYACATPRAPDDVHVTLDRYAIVPRRRAVGVDGPTVDAALITTLSPAAGAVMLNTELGDYARFEERPCDCVLGALGLTTHLSEIRSFEKLTSEGVTFLRANVEAILERELPDRFGGTSLDYQLAEEEAADGVIRLVLRIDPSVGPLDEAAVRELLLAALGRGGALERYQAGAWRSAGVLDVRRARPLATRVGKVLPLHLLRRGDAPPAAGPG